MEIVLLTQIGPHMKRWWTKELTELRQNMLQNQRRASQTRHNPENPHWESFKEARWILGRELEKAKRNHWRDWLEKYSDPDLWTAQTAPSGDGGRTRIPDLEQSTSGGKTSARNNKEKSNMLTKSFFPQKPETHEDQVTKGRHKEKPICKADPITKEQIKRALARLKPYKSARAGQYPKYSAVEMC